MFSLRIRVSAGKYQTRVSKLKHRISAGHSYLLRKAGRPIETTLIPNVIHRKTLQKPMAVVKKFADKSFIEKSRETD